MKTGYKKPKVKPGVLKAYTSDMPEMKPSMSLDSSMLPQIKKWKVGSTYNIVLEVKQTGLHERYGEGSDELCGDFQILSAKEQ